MVSLAHCLESIKSVMTNGEDGKKKALFNVHLIRSDYNHRRWSLKTATHPESSLQSFTWTKNRASRRSPAQ